LRRASAAPTPPTAAKPKSSAAPPMDAPLPSVRALDRGVPPSSTSWRTGLRGDEGEGARGTAKLSPEWLRVATNAKPNKAMRTDATARAMALINENER